MACPNQLDIFKSATEQLGPTLYRRASWQSPIFSMVPREEFPGYATEGNSVFTIERTEPSAEDETWIRVVSVQDQGEGAGPCDRTFNNSTVGYTKWVYKPEKYSMRGILICRNDLPLNWNTREFWDGYFTQLEHRGAKSLVNRVVNAMMHFVPKAAATAPADFAWVEWDQGLLPLGGTATPTPDLTVLPTPAEVDYCELTQDMLDNAALNMIYAGATEPDSEGWIQLGPNGPVFPLYIGPEISQRIFKNNTELRLDVDLAFASREDVNPLLKRVGASQVLKNFRHVINLFPPRWAWDAQFGWVRVNAFTSAAATKGTKYVINPVWLSTDETFSIAGLPNGAPYEAAIIPSPWVMHDQIMRPISEMRNAKWSPVDWMGQWIFATGTDALNSADCGTNVDPFHDYGRHFGQYWHALKPIHPEYGRMILFKRCAAEWECPDCAT